MNEILTEKQPVFRNDALDEVARGREEYVRLVKLLEDAEAMVKDVQDFQQHAAPSFYDRSNASPVPSYGREGSMRNDGQQRAANNTSPWQRGAGYDH